MGAISKKKRNRFATVDIVDMSHDGRGVGRLEGKTVFVSGALTGETVDIEVFKRRRKYDQARVLEVIKASDERVEPRCAVFGTCGGCALQHQTIEAQRVAKRGVLASSLEKIGEVTPRTWLPDLTGSAWSYRRKARLGVKYVEKKQRVLVGFRERVAPYITDMQRCEVLTPVVGRMIGELAELIGGLSIRASLPQIEVAAGDDFAALVMRVLEPPSVEDCAALETFGQRHDVDLYLQSGGLDTVEALGSSRQLSYSLPAFDVTVEFTPIDFVQIHGELNRLMVERVIELLDPKDGDGVLDLFSGLGNFTLPLARRAARVVGVEGDAALVERGRANARRNGLHNAEFYSADLFEPEKWNWPGNDYDLVLLDPPRLGAQQVLSTVASSGARRIVYVSCHPGTLARDAGELVASHGYELAAVGIMDMFPHTAHVESVAVFERS